MAWFIQYDFARVEKGMYAWWEAKGFFKPRGNPSKRSFVVPMPPPNVTGYLHMGHAIGTTLQVLWALGCLRQIVVFLSGRMGVGHGDRDIAQHVGSYGGSSFQAWHGRAFRSVPLPLVE